VLGAIDGPIGTAAKLLLLCSCLKKTGMTVCHEGDYNARRIELDGAKGAARWISGSKGRE
jgi:hypothetical protein